MNRAMRRAKTKAARPEIPIPVMFRFSQDDDRHLKLVPQMAYAMLIQGRGGPREWETVATRLNWAGTIAKRHFCEDAVSALKNGLEAVLSIKARNARIGKWGMSGDEATIIHAALTLADDMQDRCTRREMRDSLQDVFRQTKSDT